MVGKQHRQTDARIKKSQIRLRRAYFTLLETDTRISIAAIADSAGVTRGTFYQHYKDKAAFEQAVVSDSITDFMSTVIHTRVGVDGPARMNLSLALAELIRHDNGFHLLFTNIDGRVFSVLFANAVADAIQTNLIPQGVPEEVGKFHRDDLVAVIARIMVGLFRDWVFQPVHKRNASYTESLIREVSQAATLNQFGMANFFY